MMIAIQVFLKSWTQKNEVPEIREMKVKKKKKQQMTIHHNQETMEKMTAEMMVVIDLTTTRTSLVMVDVVDTVKESRW